MKKIFNWKFGLILIILLAAFLRLWQLGSVPSGIPDDEAAYIYNAYSVWHTGKDILGNLMPLSFNAHSSMSPVPVYLIAPFVGTLGLSAFSGRLPAALASIGSVFLLFLLAKNIFKNRLIALFSALLLAISPWALQIGRGAIPDAVFALFFLLFGIYVFVVNIHTRRFLWSLVPFLLGFYSYHATKVYLIFLIPALIFFYRKELLKRKKEAALFLSGCLLILLSFLIVVETQTVTRQTNVSLLNDPKVAIEVNWERQYNTAPWILRTIFSNKPLYYLKSIRENYLKAFSPEYLFLSGEGGNFSAIVNIYYRGELYIIELPLLLLGIYALFKNKDKFSRNFILALLLISPLPSTFTVDSNFVDRDIMMLPILLTIIACGLTYLLERVALYKNMYRYIFISFFVLVYLFLFTGYLYQYYYRWTVYGSEAWGTSSTDLVKLVAREKEQYKDVYISSSYRNFLTLYAVIEKLDPRVVQNVWNRNPIKIYNVTMLAGCLNNGEGIVKDFISPKTLYVSSAQDCHYRLSTPSAKIVDKSEPLHVIWNIYENK
jgi:4-amino-4-deoxy-L-arabinose transferase-like glycosyltransferase